MGGERGRKKKKPARRRQRSPEAELDRKLKRLEEGTLPRGFSASRDAMAAMVVVRAIERAQELAGEDGSRGLRSALKQARIPMEEYVQRQLRTPRRKKA